MSNNISTLKRYGFTLMEMLVVLLLLSFVTTGIYNLYIYGSKTYLNQLMILNISQNAKQALEFMASDLKLAGYAYNAPSSSQPKDSVKFVDNNNNPDEITIYRSIGWASTITQKTNISSPATTLQVAAVCDSDMNRGYSVGNGLILMDVLGNLKLSGLTVNAVDCATDIHSIKINVPAGSSAQAEVGYILAESPYTIRYYVDTTTNELKRDITIGASTTTQIVAKYIENLQFECAVAQASDATRVQLNGSDVFYYNSGLATNCTAPVFGVKIYIVARAPYKSPLITNKIYRPPAIANYPAGNYDRYPRRMFSTVVFFQNNIER